jgi:hypothetical protein
VPSGPGKEHTVPTYKLVTEDGTWLTDERLNGFDWRAGDRIYRVPGDTLEVVEVQRRGRRSEADSGCPFGAWLEERKRGPR